MSEPYLIVGLGNPGRGYRKTRHNIGFQVVDQFADRWGASFKRGKGQYEICRFRSLKKSGYVMKPLTYMNLSGTAVSQVLNYYRINLERILVIYDEVELPFGQLRMRPHGSAAGHKGMSSIIEHINSKQFARLRIGIGTEFAKRDMTKFVLSNFSRNEQKELVSIIEKSVDATIMFIDEGIEKAMTFFNSAARADSSN